MSFPDKPEEPGLLWEPPRHRFRVVLRVSLYQGLSLHIHLEPDPSIYTGPEDLEGVFL
jgi:hypothetical protein